MTEFLKNLFSGKEKPKQILFQPPEPSFLGRIENYFARDLPAKRAAMAAQGQQIYNEALQHGAGSLDAALRKQAALWGNDATQAAISGMGTADLGGLGLVGMVRPSNALENFLSSWESRGVKSAASDGKDFITLSKVVVPEKQRGQGIGTEFMRQLSYLADEMGKPIALSPSTDFGATSVSRLKQFYKKFGFVENKGGSKDFSISETMVRHPKKPGRRP